MKTLATRIALATSLALATLLATEAAYAQRHYAPQSYDGASSVRDHRFSSHDQQIIDQITRTDEDAGK